VAERISITALSWDLDGDQLKLDADDGTAVYVELTMVGVVTRRGDGEAGVLTLYTPSCIVEITGVPDIEVVEGIVLAPGEEE
jgi:hypothetical protein